MSNKAKTATLIFPNQLFQTPIAVAQEWPVYLVEEHLFFSQFKFHKQKIALHRASMQAYADKLRAAGYQVQYVEAHESRSDIRELVKQLADLGIENLHLAELHDDWLNRRLTTAAKTYNLSLQLHESPMFLASDTEIRTYFGSKKRLYQTEFYIAQRKKYNVLLTSDGGPVGGQWTYDTENRLKYPKDKIPPVLNWPEKNKYHVEADTYVDTHFAANYGQLSDQVIYPIDHASASVWLTEFLEQRLSEFGPYEDSIVAKEAFLHHSLLTPMLNIGLLVPQQIIDATLAFAEKNEVPLNSLEGFLRQIMGWREFIRAVYLLKGREERTRNFWGFKRKMPESFWTGDTGILPIDQVIKRVLTTGYCHHIERLMVLGNFMLLCQFDPDDVYRWFMEMFIDSYDWVMVPNVYGMSQFADGGLMSTKPYISGSNYLSKMSNFAKGPWQTTWDGLFWHFMDQQRVFFKRNPRLSMLVSSFDKMTDEKRESHLTSAAAYFEQLDHAKK
jgi:deoxyribodipyrimidine photolyase-related protein